MGLIESAYLPRRKVLCAVGNICLPCVKMIEPYYIAALPESMRRHADLSLCYLGRGVAVCAPEAYDYYKKAFEGIPIELISGENAVGSNYPADAAYNVAIVGDKIFCKKSITDNVLLNTAEKMGYEIINMNQGYGKCSVCPIDKNSAISADVSFAKAARSVGVDVLLITNDNILLDGFSNGFFGGSAFMEANNIFSVNGSFDLLPQRAEIAEFLNRRGIGYKSYGKNIYDFGSFIPILEE